MATNGWQEITLGNLVDDGKALIQTGPFGSQLHSYDYLPVGVPVVPTEAIGWRRLNSEGIPRISPEKSDELSRHRLKEGDILFARRGIQATGLSALVQQQHQDWICGTGAILLRLQTDEVDPVFLSFYLIDETTRQWLRTNAVGAVMPNLNEGLLRRLPLRLPPRKQQERIADILGTLDDKIELNRRMNETLETMARRLFKSWFVDFDPVHAKAALRRENPKLSNADLSRRALPNMAPEIADLFPDTFEESALGPIPKGWRAGTVVDEFTLTMGQSPPGSTYNEIGEGVPFYQGKADFQSRFPDRRIYCTAATRYAKRFDTLVSVRAPVGAINMAREDCAIGRGLAAVLHCSGSLSYTYYAMQQQGEAFQRFEADGTVFGAINKSSFERLPHVVPEAAVVDAFGSRVANIDMGIHALTLETESLAKVRDKLLPRLLSGELKTSECKEVR